MKNESGLMDNGANINGFSDLPGDYRGSSGYFYDLASFGYLWSASENDTNDAYGRDLGRYCDNLNRVSNDKGLGLSVRCVKD